MKFLIIPVLLGLGLAGCSQSKSDDVLADLPQATPAATITAAPASTATVVLPAPYGTAENVATPQAQPGHSVAYQAELKMAVDDFDKATDRVNDLLAQHGAYLSTAHETRDDGQRRQDMTLQVPPKQFVALVSALGKLGRIENKDITAADITANSLATAARLDEQQATETQTRQQLARSTSAAERARLAGDARQQRAEASATKAQLQQFGARATWATLTLHYYQLLTATEPTAPQLPVASRFQQAFGWGWNLVLEFAVAFAYAWPALLLAAVSTWGLRRWRQRQLAA
jgi:hypothetical protein